jgi:clusterin-associated protein 1
MSFRELRNFKEIMCTLGYPRLISIENFKVPHFELVADILVWLCHRYDKNLEILDEIRTENDRVAFLKSVAEQLLVKARVKLNLKNLYSSNGFAVRELLKVAQLLYEAHKNAAADAEEGDETLPADIGPGHKFADVKLTRSLAADITKYGARLHELLGRHAEAKESASRALGKNFDVDYLQRQLHEMVSQVTEQTEQMRGMLANLEADEANLQQKIDKRKQELDRHQKRLASLQTVRPAFMDEYERLEGELSVQYSMYVQAWRNLSYLESELDAIHALEVSLVNCLGWPRMASDCLGFPLTERLWPLSRRSASPRTIGRCTRCSAGYERRSFGSCVGRPR